jgi:hypothetical protein
MPGEAKAWKMEREVARTLRTTGNHAGKARFVLESRRWGEEYREYRIILVFLQKGWQSWRISRWA